MGDLKVNFENKRKLESVLGADQLAYCYQCGACVGDCPTARFYEGFNPREIMLKSLIGDVDELTKEDSIIWMCSNCYNCYERCPQDVRPVEVIIALKNLCTQSGSSEKDIVDITQRIMDTGYSVPLMAATDKMRADLGLPPIKKVDAKELKEILNPETEEKTK
jgi:heterodisulfide reductase subunit C